MGRNPKILFLLPNCYPYGKGDSFLETEIHYLIQEFDEVIVFPSHGEDNKRSMPKQVKLRDDLILENVLKVQSSKISALLSLITFFPFWKDVFRMIKNSKLNKENLIRSFRFKRIADTKIKLLDNFIKEYGPDKSYMIYSYWYMTQAFAAARLKEKSSKINAVSRTHEYDLYEKKNVLLPFRLFMAKHLDTVIPIAEDGVVYLQKQYGIERGKIRQFNLGVENGRELSLEKRSDETFTILSVAFLSVRKRIHLIAEALLYLNDKQFNRKIEWIHVGGGDESLMKKLTDISSKFSDKIEAKFMGNYTNTQIKDLYANNPQLSVFINVSSSEGKPVSIMEAQSYGIPVIATDVGGVREIVNGDNGILLNPNPSVQEVAESILFLMNEDERIQKSKSSYQNWNEHYNAETNYTAFANYLSNSIQCAG